MQRPFRLDLETFNLAVVRRRWRILAFAVLAALAGFGITLLIPPRYDATAELLFQRNDYAQTLFGSSLQSGSVDPTREAATDLALASLDSVLARVRQDLHSSLSVSALRQKVDVTPAGQANIVLITGHARTPGHAADIANATAREVVATRREAEQNQIQAAITSLAARQPVGGRSLGSQLSQLEVLKALQTGDVAVVQYATRPLSPAAPNRLQTTLTALLVGLLLGVIGALVLYRLDPRVRDEEDLVELLGYPVLALIPTKRSSRRSGAIDDPNMIEAFQFLRLNLQLQEHAGAARAIAVMSALPGEGKTTVTIGLARAFAATGIGTVAVDLDLRRHGLQERLGLEPADGMSDALAGRAPISSLLRNGGGDVTVVTAGRMLTSPAIAVGLHRLPAVLHELAAHADYIVVDTPPIALAAEASTIAAAADAVIVVVDMSRTRRQTLIKVRRQLAGVGANVVGVVLNRTSSPIAEYSYYGDGQTASKDAGEGARTS